MLVKEIAFLAPWRLSRSSNELIQRLGYWWESRKICRRLDLVFLFDQGMNYQLDWRLRRGRRTRRMIDLDSIRIVGLLWFWRVWCRQQQRAHFFRPLQLWHAPNMNMMSNELRLWQKSLFVRNNVEITSEFKILLKAIVPVLSVLPMLECLLTSA